MNFRIPFLLVAIAGGLAAQTAKDLPRPGAQPSEAVTLADDMQAQASDDAMHVWRFAQREAGIKGYDAPDQAVGRQIEKFATYAYALAMQGRSDSRIKALATGNSAEQVILLTLANTQSMEVKLLARRGMDEAQQEMAMIAKQKAARVAEGGAKP